MQLAQADVAADILDDLLRPGFFALLFIAFLSVLFCAHINKLGAFTFFLASRAIGTADLAVIKKLSYSRQAFVLKLSGSRQAFITQLSSSQKAVLSIQQAVVTGQAVYHIALLSILVQPITIKGLSVLFVFIFSNFKNQRSIVIHLVFKRNLTL